MPLTVVTTYAPALLIFRLTNWPSLEDEITVYGKLLADNLLRDDTVALIDFRSVDIPAHGTPHPVSEMLRSSGGPRRRAYVVSTQAQAKFIEGLKSTAPPNLQVKAFYDERVAAAWLFPTAQRFPLTFLS